MNPIKVPRFIDSPMQVAFWEIDELIPIFLLFGLGIATKTLTYMFVLMYFVTKWYQKYKSTSRRGALFHWMWWQGLYDVGGRYKNGLARLYIS